MPVRSLGREDPPKEEMATHSSILACGRPGQRSLAGGSPRGCKESDMSEHEHAHTGEAQLLQKSLKSRSSKG